MIKSSKGFTFLEVVVALGIMAIIMPIVSIVFYNVLVIPPEQSDRLTLNNEVSLLSSYLYKDAHMADNFSEGVYPYYGNFSWTDYTTGDEYLIIYRGTCPNQSDPSCDNKIVREVITTYHGNASAPTATPTATATATPTVTPTPEPSTVTYTYASGGGSNKWAWAKAWNSSEWAAIDSIDPYEFRYTSNRSLLTGVSSAYTQLRTANNDSWSNPDDNPVSWDYVANSQLYLFQLSQNRSLVNNISVTWRGYGGDLTYNTKLRIWNNTSGFWYTIPTMNLTDPGSKVINTSVYNLTSSPLDYIGAGTDLVSLQVSSDINGETARDMDFGDALTFNGSNSSTVTINSTVPTDTFTFEAWVRCTEEITMYSEATSGAPGCSGQHFVFWPTWGGVSNAGVGLSVGTNGISVYEHGDGYLPPLTAYPCNLGTAWNHIAVVYSSNVSKIYLNGNLVKTGLNSTKGIAYAPNIIGYGSDWGSGPSYFNGTIDEVRLWNVALNQTQIQRNMYSGTSTDVVTYNSSGNFIPPAGVTSVQVLVVGGGGAGGGRHGGGGAGGGVVYHSAYSVTPGVAIPVTVGAGGLPTQTNPTEQSVGGNGGYSAFGSITALGGGGGGSYTAAVPTGGGSGGGGGGLNNTAAGLANQGASGGGTGYGSNGGTGGASTGGGGGGGAGAIGSNAAGADTGGNGGAGKDYSGTFGAVGGASGWFAGGGGGGGQTAGGTGGSGGGGGGGCDTGTAGTANTGGGGGGVRSLDTSVQGKQGGSGIVVVKYTVTDTALVGCLHFNNCSTDILDGVMEDSSTYNNDGTLSSPAPQCMGGVARDLTPYTDYVALTVTTSAAPSPTVSPAPTPIIGKVEYNSTGTFSWHVPDNVTSVNVLVVAGGGGGGGASVANYVGGGGGAGGVKYNSNYTVTPDTNIEVVVGIGGHQGGGHSGATTDARGTSGGDSKFNNAIIATGGGGGGGGGSTLGDTYRSGRNGGSGGGMGAQTSAGGSVGTGNSGEGNNGGTSNYECCWYILWCSCLDRVAGGGGGGAGGVGGSAPSGSGGKHGGAGGIGILISEFSGYGYFGGGGGGGSNGGTAGAGGDGGGGAGSNSNSNGTSGTDKKGGGGGGAASTGSWTAGGNGGSGIVLISYNISYKTLYTSANGSGTVVQPSPPGMYYPTGTTVPINATNPDPCYHFVNWTGTGVSEILDPYDDSTTIHLTDNFSVQANFALGGGNYSLTLTPVPAGGGNPYFEGSGSSTFPCGTSVPIYADANPGYSFTGWTTTDGVTIANPNASDTTVLVTDDCVLEAHYTSGPTVTPSPTPVTYESELYVAWHIAANNFSLTQSSKYIVANMTSTMNTNRDEYVEKQLTVYIQPRPIYLLPEENIWGENTFSTIGSLRFDGTYASISGNVEVNGTVTVTSAAYMNMIDGTLTCPSISWLPNPPNTKDTSKLDATKWVTQTPNVVMPDIGTPDDIITTNLSTGTTDWDEADRLHEYVFTDSINLTTGCDQCWVGGDPDDSHELKPGIYYSPHTITLTHSSGWTDGPTTGTVTFIADQIIINNAASGGLIRPKITLGPYHEDILCWANGSMGIPTTPNDGAILIQGESVNHACVSLEGVLFAPNGEIELAGSGRTGWLGMVDAAELYRGALVAKHLTISGDHWNFYRW